MPRSTIPEAIPHSPTLRDDDAQLQSAQGYTSGGSPVAAEQFGFVYDAGFSMTERSVNGTATTYTVNDLNEATSDGANGFAYDANGNMTSGNNGHNGMVYDDENRLVQWFYYTNSASQPINGDLRTDFVYDGLGRLRKRLEYLYSVMTNSPGGGETDSINPGVGTDSFEEPPPQPVWTLLTEVRYIYDSRRVIQERDSNNVPVVTYTRGKDLSGSLEGAGGIGGLLARSSGYSSGTWQTHNYYFSDGNGNVTCLRGWYPSTLARYRYDAYGRTLDSSGDLANANVYRFSSKEIHVNSGMYYYLYRFYSPNLQRWPNRDPIGETGGINLYAFVRNTPTMIFDPLGHMGCRKPPYSSANCLGFIVGQNAWLQPGVNQPYDDYMKKSLGCRTAGGPADCDYSKENYVELVANDSKNNNSPSDFFHAYGKTKNPGDWVGKNKDTCYTTKDHDQWNRQSIPGYNDKWIKLKFCCPSGEKNPAPIGKP